MFLQSWLAEHVMQLTKFSFEAFISKCADNDGFKLCLDFLVLSFSPCTIAFCHGSEWYSCHGNSTSLLNVNRPYNCIWDSPNETAVRWTNALRDPSLVVDLEVWCNGLTYLILNYFYLLRSSCNQYFFAWWTKQGSVANRAAVSYCIFFLRIILFRVDFNLFLRRDCRRHMQRKMLLRQQQQLGMEPYLTHTWEQSLSLRQRSILQSAVTWRRGMYYNQTSAQT